MFYELTNAQKSIWYLEKMYEGLPVNVIGGYKIITGNIDLNILEESIQLFIKENDGIRLRFVEKNDEVLQYIEEYNRKSIDILDFSNANMPYDEFNHWVEKCKKESFDRNESLYYLALFKLSETEKGYFLKINHLIADGWSIDIMDKQIRRNYENLVQKKELENHRNQNTDQSFVHFIEDERKYLQSKYFKKNKEFWINKFKDIPKDIITESTFDIKSERECFRISGDRLKNIKNIAEKYSINVFFTAVYAIYLNKVKKQKEFIIGMPVFNRGGSRNKQIFGMNTSTMLFRFLLNDDYNIFDYMSYIKKELFQCYLNQKYPYHLLISDLELKKKSISTLYNTCINYYNTELCTKFHDCNVENFEFHTGYQGYSMQLVIKELTDRNEIQLMFDYKSELYSLGQINKMYEDFMIIIDQVIECSNEKINNLNLSKIGYRNQFIYDFNHTECDYEKEKSIYELFEEQVKKTPDKTAIVDGECSISYRELNHKANKLARTLVGYGINKDEIIGILNTNSIETVICILAILKAGAAYLPIDVKYPVKRIEHMLSECRVNKLFVKNDLNKEITYDGAIFQTDSLLLDDSYTESIENLNIRSKQHDLVYVIFTSGSTGKPKGVMIEEQGLVNYISWGKKMYQVEEQDVFPLYSSLAFDLTVTSIFLPLISGAQITIYSDDNQNAITKIINDNKCTIIKLTPSHLNLLKNMEIKNSNIKKMIVGGEELKSSLALEIHDLFDGNIQIFNEYGPTETVVGCMIHQYNTISDNSVTVPIGVPISNTRIYVLNESLEPTDIDQIGEIYIAGDGVARGYINNKKLTEERFLDDPFVQGKKMYKSGDLAKHLSSGVIEYDGRKDSQVKIRGYRIELGEIEEKINMLPEIKESVVTMEEFSTSKQLCAFVVKDAEISPKKIRKHLSNYIPEYMIPIEFIEISKIPININGKIDRIKLTDIKEKIRLSNHTKDAMEDHEDNILNVFKEVLNVSQITEEDNFYYLGGDSIKAIQIVSKLDELGYLISVSEILSEPHIKNIVLHIKTKEQNQKIEEKFEVGKIERTPIISWFMNKEHEEPGHYFQSIILTINEFFSEMDMKRVIYEIMNYHDSLRIHIVQNELIYNEQYIDNHDNIKTYDISDKPIESQDEFINNILKNIRFDLNKDRLFQAIIFKCSNGKNRVLLAAHHLIIDGVSWRIILDDLYTGLDRIKKNKEIKFMKKTDSLKGWSEELQRKSKDFIKTELEYWQNITNQISENKTDYNYFQDTEENARYVIGQVEKKVTEDLLNKANIPYNTKTNELLICALALAMKEFNLSDQVTISIEGHGRDDVIENVNIKRTIGWFTCIYPVHFVMDGTNLNNHIKQVKENLRTIPNGGIGFSVLNEIQNLLNYDDANMINFNYLGDFSSYMQNDIYEVEKDGLELYSSEKNKMNYLLDINCFILDGSLKIRIEYSKNIYAKETIESFMNLHLKYINMIVKHCTNKNKIEFTPSDFDTVKLSFEDLDMLFH